jgi:membrane protein DedA with SNARE-associated domain
VVLEHWVEMLGYPAIVLGTIMEGETILLIAGMYSCWGYLNLPLTMLMAFIGSFSGDQMFFYLGRCKGHLLLDRCRKWQFQVDRIHRFLNRRQDLVIFGFRFLYGFRLVTPLILGMDRSIKTGRFMVLNGLSAIVWSTLVAGVGYFFGEVIQVFLPEIKKLQIGILLGFSGLGVLIWMVRRYRSRAKIL